MARKQKNNQALLPKPTPTFFKKYRTPLLGLVVVCIIVGVVVWAVRKKKTTVAAPTTSTSIPPQSKAVMSSSTLAPYVATTSLAPTPLRFPPATLTSNTTTILGQSYGSGTYTITGNYTNVGMYKLFDNNPETYTTISPNGTYQATGTDTTPTPSPANGGEYTGSVSTTAADGKAYKGAWVQARLPLAVQPTQLTLKRITTGGGIATFVLLGGTDGKTWDLVHEQATDVPYAGGSTGSASIPIKNPSYYTYFRLVATRAGTPTYANGRCEMTEVQLDGFPFPDVSATLDPARRYPPTDALSYNTNLIAGMPYGNGIYNLTSSYASKTTWGSGLWTLFNGDLENRMYLGAPNYVAYSSNTLTTPPGAMGSYIGTATTTDAKGDVYRGEWVQAQFPVYLYLSKLAVYRYWSGSQPKSVVLLGSTNGTVWDKLLEKNGIVYTALDDGSINKETTSRADLLVASSTPYPCYRMVVTEAGNRTWSTDNFNLSELEFFGTELPAPARFVPIGFSNSTSTSYLDTGSIAFSADLKKAVALSGANLYYATYKDGAYTKGLFYTLGSGMGTFLSARLSADGTRGVAVSNASGYCYTFSWTGDAPSNFVPTKDTVARVFRGLAMTPDGNRIIITDITNNCVCFAAWDGENYSAFQKTLETNANPYIGLAVSADGSRIVYGTYNTTSPDIWFATWDGSNYSAGTKFSNIVNDGKQHRTLQMTSDGSTVFALKSSPTNQHYYTWDGTNYSSPVAIPTTAVPSTDAWASFLSADNRTLIVSGNQTTVYY